MTGTVLILRPEPGARATAARAEAMGLRAVVAPLFTIVPAAWEPADPRRYDAIVLTSANAPRCAGTALAPLCRLPAYAVGEATAAAARDAGFADVRTGPSDGGALLAFAAGDGVRRALHLCGRDNLPLEAAGITTEQRVVYAAEAVAQLPVAAEQALAGGAVALLHSPRAARTFASLVARREGVRLALISAAASEAAGEGWAAKAVAGTPRDEALLEVARGLCQSVPPDAAGAGA